MKFFRYISFVLLLLPAGWLNAQRNNNEEELDRLIREMRQRMREQQAQQEQPVEEPAIYDEAEVNVVEEDESEPAYITEGATSDVEQQYLSNTQQERNISREEWRKIVNGEDFSETRTDPPKDRDNDLSRNYDGRRNRGGGGDSYNGDRPNRPDSPTPIVRDRSSGPSFLGIPSIVMFVVLGILIAFLIFLLLSGGNLKRNQKVKKKDYEITIDNLEDYIHESDLDRFLRECLAKGQYREAIRVYYLTVIRTLSEKKLIDWRKDKTNRAYMAEMRSHAKFSDFQQVTLTYERIWFGDSAFNKEDYPQAAALFQNILKTI